MLSMGAVSYYLRASRQTVIKDSVADKRRGARRLKSSAPLGRTKLWRPLEVITAGILGSWDSNHMQLLPRSSICSVRLGHSWLRSPYLLERAAVGATTMSRRLTELRLVRTASATRHPEVLAGYQLLLPTALTCVGRKHRSTSACRASAGFAQASRSRRSDRNASINSVIPTHSPHRQRCFVRVHQ